MRPRSSVAGFTLVEMIIVIAIMGIVGAMVAVFLRAPLESYVAQDRRARLTDTADTALRRMGREVRLALPNSVRVTNVGTVVYLEFLATRSGGRYRTQGDGTAGNDPLDFTAPDTSFDVLGPPITMRAGELIAVYNLGIPGADAWAGNTLANYGGTAGATSTVTLAPAMQFPLASPGNRFQVVEGPVTYECNPTTGNLTRYWGYAVNAAQPTAFAAGTPRALLADQIEACTFTYSPGVTERGGLVSMTLNLLRENERVWLYHSMQVENQP
ncbi:MAG: type II secretion system protein [Thiobacillus sp.]|nr:type II secretion system protein [Thiobacillus sp.]